jgi:glycosyltransferase involved in cell wall biosynthesis
MKKEFGAKIVVDVMDAWPETFERLFPAPLKFLSVIALLPLRRAAKRAYRGADLVTGVCDAYGDIARANGAREYARFYHGIDTSKARATNVQRPPLSFVYAGNFGRGYDLSAAIKAILENEDATLDIAGAGEREAEWRVLAAHSPRIRFHGYLSGDELDKLLGNASIGIIPLSDNTFVGLPYKLGDYAAHNLRMVTSLRGECAAILKRHNAGAVYDTKDADSFMAAAKKVQASTPDFDSLLSELDAEKIYASYVDRVSALANTRQ